MLSIEYETLGGGEDVRGPGPLYPSNPGYLVPAAESTGERTMDYRQEEDAANPFANFSLSGLLSNGGILNKAVDTALDVWAIKNKPIGSVYPTGQNSPKPGGAALPKAVNFTPYIIGGAALVTVVILIAVIRRK